MNLGVDVAATFTAEGTDEFQVEAGFEVEDGETWNSSVPSAVNVAATSTPRFTRDPSHSCRS